MKAFFTSVVGQVLGMFILQRLQLHVDVGVGHLNPMTHLRSIGAVLHQKFDLQAADFSIKPP